MVSCGIETGNETALKKKREKLSKTEPVMLNMLMSYSSEGKSTLSVG